MVGAQPSVQDPDRIVQTVGATDRDESLTAADSARASEGVEGREGKLRLRQREPSLVA